MKHLWLLWLVPSAFSNLQDASLRYCESYTECVAVSTLEERLCIGNSRHRPYWLPSFHDPKQCYQKLKNDYKMLDHLEVELEKKYTACLIEQTVPMTEEQSNGQRCSDHLIRDAPKFSFARTISYIPTNCFTGYERRLEKECGRLKSCCAATNRCRHILKDSDEAQLLNATRTELWKRAKGCERGEPIEPLQLALEIAAQNDEDQAWSPKGNITFRVRDQETLKKEEDRKQSHELRDEGKKRDQANRAPDQTGTIRVNIHEERKWNAERAMEKSEDITPQLRFPKEEEKENEQPFPNRPAPSIEEHNRMFNEALKNDKMLKEKLRAAEQKEEAESRDEKLETTEKKVGNTLDSLLGAASAAGAAKTFDEGEPITPSPEDLQDLEEEADPINLVTSATMVTSPPVILIKPNKTGCRQRKTPLPEKKTSKMIDLDKVMAEMDGTTSEEGMATLRGMLDGFKGDIRARLVDAKERAHKITDNKKVVEALDELIANYDRSLAEIEKESATFAPNDYPEEDAEIAGSICDPLPATDDSSLERDEHNEKIVVQAGEEKLVIDNGNLVLEGRPEHVGKDEGISPEEYKKELEQFQKAHHIESSEIPERNETACDLYMRCRSQMHLALDGCAWRFAASSILPTYAESPESLLARTDDICDPDDRPLYQQLEEIVTARNGRLNKCLGKLNEQFFASSVCLPFPINKGMEYNSAFLRVLTANYTTSIECFNDANLIQEKSTKLRMCCPNFDRCRDDTLDIAEEQAIISQTAKVNERKQACIRRKTNEQVDKTLREMLGKGGAHVLKKIHDRSFLQPPTKA